MAVETSTLSRWARRQAAFALMTATAMQAFDATIVNVALPEIEPSLGGGIEFGAWVMTSYLCAAAVMAPLTGWLRRRYGGRDLFTGSIVIFVVSALLCAFAPSAGAMILLRLIQGAAGGIIHPLAQALLLDLYPKRQHGRMLAIWGAMVMVGPILGPVLGGIITDLASWRWIFAVNAPLGALAVAGLHRFPPVPEATREAHVDFVGMLLLVGGVGALQLWLQRSIGRPITSPEFLAEGVVAILAITGMVFRTLRSPHPLFRLEIFADVNFSTATAYIFLICGVLFTTMVFLPALSEGPLGYGATAAGLAISPRAAATMATMLAVGYLIDRIDNRLLLAAGLVVTAAALELIAQVPPVDSALWFAVASTIQGAGIGLSFTPVSMLSYSSLPESLRTDAAGAYTLLRQLGNAVGIAIMTSVLQNRIEANTAAIPGHEATAGILPQLVTAATFQAYSECFRVLALVSLAIVPGILLFRVLRPQWEGGEAR